MVTEKQILERWRTLTPEKQQQLLEFLEELQSMPECTEPETEYIPQTPLAKKLPNTNNNPLHPGNENKSKPFGSVDFGNTKSGMKEISREHVEYIHYNPVRHGLARSPKDWEFSSFHRYVREGLYDIGWGEGEEIRFAEGIGNE